MWCVNCLLLPLAPRLMILSTIHSFAACRLCDAHLERQQASRMTSRPQPPACAKNACLACTSFPARLVASRIPFAPESMEHGGSLTVALILAWGAARQREEETRASLATTPLQSTWLGLLLGMPTQSIWCAVATHATCAPLPHHLVSSLGTLHTSAARQRNTPSAPLTRVSLP